MEFEYVHKPEFKDRRFFRKGLWGQGTCHLHICEINSSEWIEKILFRDYLRLHPIGNFGYALLLMIIAP
ncbi:GrpB family protein [Lysinibacillus fusiformis]|uniref:GrpB family protein n=1 Tax=Lysinibacillus fusiformis TaxID=28031 RepID=UPI0037F32439